MLKSAEDVIATGDVASIVDFAIEVSRTLVSATKDLAEVKQHLRKLAERECSTTPASTTSHFEGRLGVATVVIPTKSTFKARKGMNVLDLKTVLPEELFSALFVERVVADVSAGYEDHFADLSPSQRRVVEKFVGPILPTPRVSLPE